MKNIFEKKKPSEYHIVFTITEGGQAILIHSNAMDPRLPHLKEFTDGEDLLDNLTDGKNLPEEWGIYTATLYVDGGSYFNGDTTEYDMYIWIDNVKKAEGIIDVGIGDIPGTPGVAGIKEGTKIKTNVYTLNGDYQYGEVFAYQNQKCFDGSFLEVIYVKFDDGAILPYLMSEIEIVNN